MGLGIVWMVCQAVMPAVIGATIDHGVTPKDMHALLAWTGLGKTEKLQISISLASDGFFLVFAAAGDNLYGDALSSEIGSSEPIHTSDLAIEFRVSRLDVGVPNQIGELITGSDEFEIGCAAGGGVDGITSGNPHPIRDYKPLVVERKGTDKRDPEQRRIGVVVNAFPQVLVNLARMRLRFSNQSELRTFRVWRLATD
jgi:hypothetical protein